jgi:hypothetical protein
MTTGHSLMGCITRVGDGSEHWLPVINDKTKRLRLKTNITKVKNVKRKKSKVTSTGNTIVRY